MKAIQAKVKLLTQMFLFGEKISLKRGEETVFDISKLGIGDLEILAHHIRRGEIESNVASDRFYERAATLRKEVAQGKYDNVLKLEDVQEVRVLEAEIELEDGTKTTLAALEEAQKADPRIQFVTDKILDAATSVAMIAVKNIPDVTLEILEFAKESETRGKNRRGVITTIESEIARLKEAPAEEEAQESDKKETEK